MDRRCRQPASLPSWQLPLLPGLAWPMGPHPGSLTQRQSLEMEGPAPDGPCTTLSLGNRIRHACQPRRGGQDLPGEKGGNSVSRAQGPHRSSERHSQQPPRQPPAGWHQLYVAPVQLCAHQRFSRNIPSWLARLGSHSSGDGELTTLRGRPFHTRVAAAALRLPGMSIRWFQLCPLDRAPRDMLRPFLPTAAFRRVKAVTAPPPSSPSPPSGGALVPEKMLPRRAEG